MNNYIKIGLVLAAIVILSSVTYVSDIFMSPLSWAIAMMAVAVYLLIYKYKIYEKRVFEVISWHLIFRWIISISVALLMSSAIYLVDLLIGSEVMDSWLFTLLTLSFTAYFGQNDVEDDEVVPEAHVAMLTFWKKRLDWYRSEGAYSWTGKHLGLGRSMTVLSDGQGINQDGFIRTTAFPLSIWNQKDQKGVMRLVCPSRDTSLIYATLTLTVQIADAYKWTNSSDPVLDLAEQARKAFRTAVAFFTAVDCTLLKDIFTQLMDGETVFTIFISHDTKHYPKGSVVRDKSGAPMYAIKKSTDEASDISPISSRSDAYQFATKGEFLEYFKKEASQNNFTPDTNNSVSLPEPSEEDVMELTVGYMLDDVLTRLGVKIIKSAVGSIAVSEEVTKESNRAASEEAQRRASLISAHTIKLSSEIIEKSEATNFSKALAAEKDSQGNNVKVVITESSKNGNPLTDAAATLATLSNKSQGDN